MEKAITISYLIITTPVAVTFIALVYKIIVVMHKKQEMILGIKHKANETSTPQRTAEAHL